MLPSEWETLGRDGSDGPGLALGHIGAFTTRTAKNLERQVLGKLADWRTMLRQEAPDARQVLRQLITERVTCEPTERDGQRLYAYRGRVWFGGLFEGTISPLALASPTGFEPVFWP